MIGIIMIIMIYVAKKSKILETHESLPYWIMLAVTILTALSGFRYLATNWRLFFPEKQKSEESNREN